MYQSKTGAKSSSLFASIIKLTMLHLTKGGGGGGGGSLACYQFEH